MSRISRAQLENNLKTYEEFLKKQDLGNYVTENYINYNPSAEGKEINAGLEYSIPDDLDENKFDENLPVKQDTDRVFIKYELRRIKGNNNKYFRAGQEQKGSSSSYNYVTKGGFSDRVHGFIVSSDDLSTRKKRKTKPVNYVERIRSDKKAVRQGTKETFTWIVDVTDIIEPAGKHGSGTAYVTVSDARSRTKDLIKRVKGVVGDFSDAKGFDGLDHLTRKGGGDNKNKGGYFYKDGGSAFEPRKDVRADIASKMKKVNDINHNIRLYNEFNPKFNAYAKNINDFNRDYNRVKNAKKQAYEKAIEIAKQTKKGYYTNHRDDIRSIKKLEEAGISAEDSQKILGDVESAFKDFYRSEKLYRWDSRLGTKPDFGDFNPSYYGTAYQNVKNKYKEYEDNDDIDVTEGYGEDNYYWWHYTNQGKAEGKRGNPAERLSKSIDYEEKSPDFAEGGWAEQTDAELAFIRDNQLGIGNDQTNRFLSIPEIASLWEEAKQADAAGEDNHFINLGKQYFLDVNNADDFTALFRLSDREEDKQIKFVNNIESGVSGGITELEDAITTTIGVEGMADTKRFAALNQNILKDSIEELKKAKLKEQELELLQGFGSFGEIFDINKTLTDSLLNDTGIGGYLPFTGKKGGFDAESLEEQLKGVTGVRNEVVYNWQEWFDNAIKEKYQQDLDLGFTLDEVEQNVQIQKEFAESYINSYLKPRFDESRSMNEFVEYLDVRQEEQNPFQTESLLNALQNIGNERAKTFLDQIRQDAVDAGGKRGFDSEFYFDPTVSQGSEENTKYIKQRDTVASDWDQARDKPNAPIEGLGYDTTWKVQAYRYGVDVNNKDQFAKLHYQVKGQHMKDANGEFDPFDPAEDIVNVDKVKDLIYDNILPALETQTENTKTIFGNFVRPDEFADDMLEGLDPNQPESWNSALKELGLENFEGTLEDLKEYVSSTLRTGSAEDIRAQIKYLNEKRKKPKQELLGVEYIAREEDYKPIDKLKGDTELYKTFQAAGYEGTEDDFYENVFPDLDPESQRLLSQAGAKDGKITLEGFGKDYKSDPFAAFGSITKLTGDDSDIYGGVYQDDDDDREKKDVADSFRIFPDDDDEGANIFGSYRKTKSGQDLLDEYKNNFNFGGLF